ncbi:MAG TPA: sulfurtransferase [Pseudogracilibacillus sp.]|nr:sulfurtransferase [Pseudogracilibacillus sp.]
MEPIIRVEQLNKWLQENNVTVIDVRSGLNNPDAGEAAYNEAHIPKAYYLHLERDLSGEVSEHGGNHPLPDAETLAATLREMGVAFEKPIVIYDERNGMFAARAWWLLNYLGHSKTYLLDGGFVAWKDAGYDTTDKIPPKRAGNFTADVQQGMTRSMEEVKNRDAKTILIDSRSPERYAGEVEPLYDKSGHIPGAENYFWKDVLDEDGAWKSKAALTSHFKTLDKADEIIVSCGSGISACPNIVALKRAGFENVKLYPGSYSDWISYDDNPVESGEK